MALIDYFGKSEGSLARLPSGSFTVNREGGVIVSTVSSVVPPETIEGIARCVLETFREAQAARLPLSQLDVQFGAFKIVARELRGGAIVFLSPRNLITPTKQP